MYLNSSSNSYEKKYRKYKNKYQILKNQLGGDCNPLPDEEDIDVISTENLSDLDADERITIQNRCYEVRSLYEWIINHNQYKLPDTQVIINDNDRQRLIQAYNLLYQFVQPLVPEKILTRNVLIQLYPNLEQQTWLDLSNKQYTKIDINTFLNLPNLVYLNLSNNQINNFEPDTFYNIPRLQCLNLSYNNLVTIEPGIFNNLRILEELHLNNNQLNLIQSNLFNLPNLKRLYLDNNQLRIRKIDINAFNNLSRLTELSLYNNYIVRIYGNNININSPFDNLSESCKIYLQDALTFIRQNYNLSTGCNPEPNPNEEDLFTTQNLLDLCPEEKITIQNKCYEVRSLYRWIVTLNKNQLPDTQQIITAIERENLIRAYQSIRIRRR